MRVHCRRDACATMRSAFFWGCEDDLWAEWASVPVMSMRQRLIVHSVRRRLDESDGMIGQPTEAAMLVGAAKMRLPDPRYGDMHVCDMYETESPWPDRRFSACKKCRFRHLAK
jgi:hypothetical protein